MSYSQSMLRTLGAAVLVAIAGLVMAGSSAANTELLFFTSSHCGPCQKLKPAVEGFIQSGYPIRPIDINQHPALASRFRVMRVPSLVMVKDGVEQARRVGGNASIIQQMFDTVGFRPKRETAARPNVNHAEPPAPSLPRYNPQQQQQQRQQQRQNTPPPAVPSDQFAKQLLESSVRITVQDSTGKSYGTGTIVDTRQGDALVVTCGHLFRGNAKNGDILIERFSVTPTGLRVIERTRGNLESCDLNRDVGLVSFRPQAPVTTAKVAQQFGQRVNDRLWSVGCDLGADPTIRDSRITDIDRYHGPPNVETSGAPIQGRSGGGLFNRNGELVGVCFAADNEADEGLYAGLASVHAQLDEQGFQDIYIGQRAAPGQDIQPRQNGNTRSLYAEDQRRTMTPIPPRPPVYRGQQPSQFPSPSGAGTAALPPVGTPAPTPPSTNGASVQDLTRQMSPVERASLQELARRATESEVLIVVRPREAGGNSEVIKLDRVSPEFVQALRMMTR